MARAIYSIKMWLFREQFPLQPRLRGSRGTSYIKKVWDHLQEVCLFASAIYVKYWFQCPSSTGAPMNDLILLRELSMLPRLPQLHLAVISGIFRNCWWASVSLMTE